MGNRKNRIKAQKIFDEMGFGRLYSKKIHFLDQIKPREVLELYDLFTLGMLYDCVALSNSKVFTWNPPITAWNNYYKLIGRIILDNGSDIDHFDMTSFTMRECYFANSGRPKSRLEIESILLSHPNIKPQIKDILECGGHVHDEEGVLLPEIYNNKYNIYVVWQTNYIFTNHPVLEGELIYR